MDAQQESPYGNIEASKQQFRLIRILDTDAESVACELGTFSLLQAEFPSFTALSYRWGDDVAKFTINLGGRPILIRRNLYLFFQQMIVEKQRNWFFIDALCIDQKNQAETAVQVQQMGDIYRQAQEVMAWVVHEPYRRGEDGQIEYDPISDPYDISSLSHEERKTAVFQNSYWSRLWVLQEILLAKELKVRFGDSELDWRFLTRSMRLSGHDALPKKNKNLEIQQQTTEPYANAITAHNILTYRKYMSDSLRLGSRLSFNKAFDFFALQRCHRIHDKVFGYLGLTNSRIKVDYSMPILDLFLATLCDYLMSAGFITEDILRTHGRWRVVRKDLPSVMANDLIAPFLAFGLDPFDPVITLLFSEVLKFFAPGCDEGICSTVLATFWTMQRFDRYAQDLQDFINSDEHKWEFMYVGSCCVKIVKLVSSEMSAMLKLYKGVIAEQKKCASENAVMTTRDGQESKRHSEWVAYTRAIAEDMWQRYQESGEDADGDMDDEESWTLIA